MATGKKSKRGFANMSPEKLREIARIGGRSVPAEKRAFSKDRELAKAAGRAGGEALPNEKRTFATSRELASAAGRKGGAVRKADRRQA
jgi:general stress protein YciG